MKGGYVDGNFRQFFDTVFGNSSGQMLRVRYGSTSYQHPLTVYVSGLGRFCGSRVRFGIHMAGNFGRDFGWFRPLFGRGLRPKLIPLGVIDLLVY